MEWMVRLNKAVQYLEEHLAEEIEYAEAARIACCSTYHFQRMFAYMAGIPLSEYIRRRRMSLAAEDLQAGGKIVDIALKYGYSSPTAFNRAFQSIHGIAPSLVKEKGVMIKAYPPIRFQIIIQGVTEMTYRIEKKEAFRVVGFSEPLDHDIEKNFKVVPQMWQKAAAEGTIPQLVSKMNAQPMGILGISDCGRNEEWRYWIGAASTAAADGLEELTVPAFTWAIFPGEGVCPQAIQELEKRIVTEWLPSSGYEYDNGPDIELYLEPDPQKARFEVWIPVVKK